MPTQPKPIQRFDTVELLRGLSAGLFVGLGALVLVWPALLNRYPLLNPDSLGYLTSGRLVLHALLSPHTAVSFEARAEFYALLLYALEFGGRTLWPIVFFQALLCSWILWLTVRVFAPTNTAICFFATLLPLALMSGLSWRASWIMTDIVGGLAYLALFLLVVAPDTLSRTGRWGVMAIAWFGITAHPSHLILAAGLCVLFSLLAGSRQSLFHRRTPQIAAAALLVTASAISLGLLHRQLYGSFSIAGTHPPYLTARVIADGPGRLYLQHHCPQERWLLCPRAFTLPTNSADILWTREGIFWQGMSPAERSLIRAQETPFVLSSVRACPRLQLAQSLRNINDQARAYGFRDFVTSNALDHMSDGTIHQLREDYSHSLQSRNALPLRFATRSQQLLLVVTVPALLLAIASTPGRHAGRIHALAAMVAFVLVANICVCSVLSAVDDRFGNRILWLAPLLAVLATINWINTRRIGSNETCP